MEEEAQEAHLERITLEMSGPGAPSVLLTRLDNSTTEPKTIVTTIPNVLRINVQFDTDDSEAGLEIEDKHHVLTIVRLESLVDGAS